MAGVLMVAACGPAAQPGGQTGPEQPAPQGSASSRTLVMAMRIEPPSLISRPFQPTGQVIATSHNLVNATLAKLDEAGFPHPHLAEALPQLNTDSWRVTPDGRMETTYRLRDELTWHDGAPLSARDFLFSWQVYTAPALGAASSVPYVQMEDLLAPDDRTVLTRWRRLYPEAGQLALDFPPLPQCRLRHLKPGFTLALLTTGRKDR